MIIYGKESFIEQTSCAMIRLSSILKAVSSLDDAHHAQVYNYLHATRYKLDILLNFGCSKGLEKERIVL